MSLKRPCFFLLMLCVTLTFTASGALSAVLFSDNFNDNSINVTKWDYVGTRVAEEDGIMKIEQNITDAGGWLYTKDISFNRTGVITISMKNKLHYANENYFPGTLFGNIGGGAYWFISYNHTAYGNQYKFSIVRYDADGYHVLAETDPVWDAWFNEKIEYNPVSGLLKYYIDDVLRMQANVGPLATDFDGKTQIAMSAYGWWTGHYRHIDDFVISQSDEVSGFMSFSSISSPQTIGDPFPVTITARKVDGSVDTDFNGQVALSCQVPVSPSLVTLSNGQWSGQVTVNGCGSNLTLKATAGGCSGTSNPFTTTVIATGNVGGLVTDNRGNTLAGADVYLSAIPYGSAAYSSYSRQTDANGRYQFTGVAAGNYYLWSKYSLVNSSQSPSIYIPGGQSIGIKAPDLSISLYSSTKTPVVLVPGMTGSSLKEIGGIIPTGGMVPILPKEFGTPQDNLTLVDKTPLGEVGWQDLKIFLQASGLEPGQTIIDCPYDWRVPLEVAVIWYLRPAIQKAQGGDPSKKVNIIAHSMGGLLVRTYIQGQHFIDDGKPIENFIMVGTPNQGSTDAYYWWEGGGLRSDAIPSSIIRHSIISVMMKLYGFNLVNSPMEIKSFVNQFIPTIRQCLPTYKFLNRQNTLKPIESEEKNNFLVNLNSDTNHKDRMTSVAEADKVRTRVYYSNSEKTIDTIEVTTNNFWSLLFPGFYLDGWPISKPILGRVGDGTVPALSATFPNQPGEKWAECKVAIGSHMALVKTCAQDIAAFLYPQNPELVPLKATAETEPSRSFFLTFYGRLQPLLTDPQGNKAGIDDNGLVVNGLPQAQMATGADCGYISLANPTDGLYTITLNSIYAENYAMTMGYSDGTQSVSQELSGFNPAGKITFTVAINSGSVGKIIVNPPLAAPTNLQADSVDSGGLKTRLSWTAVPDPQVTGYNVYAMRSGETNFTLVGTTTGTSFDPVDDWAATDANIPVAYVATAKRADGTESFFSITVLNNDRDHDGLDDADEVKIGTNLTKADSDGDGYSDGAESLGGSNPLDPKSHPSNQKVNMSPIINLLLTGD